MIKGIVGSEAAKFTQETELKAREIIRQILLPYDVDAVSSGHCHIGGIDIWAEEETDALNMDTYHRNQLKPLIDKFIYPAEVLAWTGYNGKDGYKERNIKIAMKSDEVHCITLRRLPDDFTGMRFSHCYHCKTDSHVKSGGCWTAKYAQKLGKKAFWHVIEV